MCLIAFALGASTRWPLVIAANRDEYWARPTAPLARWQTVSGPPVISGRDLQAGGTWMGMSPTGRVAFLTNVREAGPPSPTWQSRGSLVARWLTGGVDAIGNAEALRKMLQEEALAGAAFGGFNLVVGDTATGLWHWLSNRLDGLPVPPAAWPFCRLSPGVYGLSNAALDTPWPKTVALSSCLKTTIARSRSNEELTESLWAALDSRTRCASLPLQAAGLSPAAASALSSVYVDFPEHYYGTRSSTLVVATAQGNAKWAVTMQERSQPCGHHQPIVHTAIAAEFSPLAVIADSRAP